MRLVYKVKILKIDEESQTNEVPIYDNAFYSSDVRGSPGLASDLEIRLKNIEERYNKKLREGNETLLIENRFNKYKDEMDKRYQEELKNEMERFKSSELGQLRIEENKKYTIKYQNKEDELQKEYEKRYEELEKKRKEFEERKEKLEKDYIEKYEQLKARYEEKEKALEDKKNYLDKKYKNDMDISAQKIKINEELIKSLQESNLRINKNNYQETNSGRDSEMEYLKRQIEELNNRINKNPYFKNNFINKEEDKKININVKPSKESVLNNLNILVKNNNSNYLNKSKSSNSPSGSGAFNTKVNNKKDLRKRLEELEEEQNKLNNEMREDFKNIINSDIPMLIVDKDEYNQIKNKNIYALYANQFKPKDIYEDNNINNNYNMKEIKEEIKNNYIYDNKNDNKNDNNNKNIEKNRNDYNNIIYNDNNINKSKNNIVENNKYNYSIKNSNNSGLFNNNINNSAKKSQNNSLINKSNNNNVNKSIKDSTQHNNVGGIGGIGGFNIGGYNYSSNNNNFNLNKNSNSDIIEEVLEGEAEKNIKKKNSVRKNNIFQNSNKYQNQTENAIKEEIEAESVASNNNSKEINNIDNNNNNKFNNYDINVNKSNKFNNYNYEEVIEDDNNDEEIVEKINDESVEKKNDIGFGSISGIVKRQGEISESGGFVGLLGLQSYAGGYGNNDKDSYGYFDSSKGKDNTHNKKGNEKQSKFNQQNTDSQNIPEESDSNF